MHSPLKDVSPSDPHRLTARSIDGFDRRRERRLSGDGLLSPRAAWARLAIIAASICILLMLFSFTAPYRSLRSTVLTRLRSSLGCGVGADAANSTSWAGSTDSGAVSQLFLASRGLLMCRRLRRIAMLWRLLQAVFRY